MRASTFYAVALSALLSSVAALPAPRPNAVADSDVLGGLLSPVTGALGSAVDNGSGNEASADGSGNGSGSGNEAGNGIFACYVMNSSRCSADILHRQCGW